MLLCSCFNFAPLFRVGRRYQAVLHLGTNSQHGLTLDLGVYIARISQGSAAAKEGSIAVGDRILNVRFLSYCVHVDTCRDQARTILTSLSFADKRPLRRPCRSYRRGCRVVEFCCQEASAAYNFDLGQVHQCSEQLLRHNSLQRGLWDLWPLELQFQRTQSCPRKCE